MKLFRLVGAIAAASLLAWSPAPAAEQSSYVGPTTGPMPMSTFVGSYLNPALRAVAAFHNGSTAPANGPGGAPLQYQAWMDTATNPVKLKFYDGSQWAELARLNTSTHLWSINATSTVGNWTVNGNLVATGTTNKVGPGADASAIPGSILYVTGNGDTNLAIRDSNANAELMLYAYSGGGIFGTNTGHQLVVRTNNTDRLTIAAAGALSYYGASANIGLNDLAPPSGVQLMVSRNAALPAASPATSAMLYLYNADGTPTNLAMDGYGNGANPGLMIRSARGTAASPSQSLSGDFIFSFNGYAYNSTGGFAGGAAFGQAIFGYALTENCASGACGGKWLFYTTATGTNTNNQKMQVGLGLSVGTSTDLGLGTGHFNGSVASTSTSSGTIVAPNGGLGIGGAGYFGGNVNVASGGVILNGASQLIQLGSVNAIARNSGTGALTISTSAGNVGIAPASAVTAITGSATVSSGVVVGGATGGNMGAGTINLASAIYINGALLSGSVTVSTQADMESASSTANVVTPARFQFHPASAKAWALVTAAGALTTGFGVTSTSNTGTGTYTINFSTAFSSTSYSCFGMGDTNVIVYASSKAVGSMNYTVVQISGGGGTGTGTNQQHQIVCYGDQ